jgi:hypothetical protein
MHEAKPSPVFPILIQRANALNGTPAPDEAIAPRPAEGTAAGGQGRRKHLGRVRRDPQES